MNNRKILGTILGIIMFAFCLIYFTYAYYTWKSEETPISLSIEDISIEFDSGPDIEVNNIGPVLDYNDGAAVEFKSINETNINVPVKINLDIASISENLQTKDFKYILLRDKTGGENYTEKIISGNFKFFDEGSNKITDCEIVNAKSTYSYKFIVYIDGNIKNNINKQNNRLESVLTFEDSEISYMTGFSSNIDYSYYKNEKYREKIKNVYFVDYINTEGVIDSWDMTDLENDNERSVISWVATNENDSNYYDLYIGSNSLIVGTNLSYLFYGLTNIESINFNNFDTSLTTEMYGMFANCNKLVNVNINKFNTTNVVNMKYMFRDCTSLTTLDISNFDTTNVTEMYGMFYNCSKLTAIITIENSNTVTYTDMFFNAATEENSKITVNYTSSTSALVDSMINTKSQNSNVIKGSLA